MSLASLPQTMAITASEMRSWPGQILRFRPPPNSLHFFSKKSFYRSHFPSPSRPINNPRCPCPRRSHLRSRIQNPNPRPPIDSAESRRRLWRWCIGISAVGIWICLLLFMVCLLKIYKSRRGREQGAWKRQARKRRGHWTGLDWPISYSTFPATWKPRFLLKRAGCGRPGLNFQNGLGPTTTPSPGLLGTATY